MWIKQQSSTLCCKSRGRRSSHIIIVCGWCAQGHLQTEQQICSPAFPTPNSERCHSVCRVPADGLAVTLWLPWNGQVTAYEPDTTWINSPSALHLNHLDTNQRRGGAPSSSTVHNLAYLWGAQLTKCYYWIKVLQNVIWLLNIGNTNIAAPF